MSVRNVVETVAYRSRQFLRYFGSRYNWRRFRIAAHRYETAAARVAWRAIRLWLCARYTPGEVLERGLGDPQVPLEARLEHISDAELHPLQVRANSPHAAACRDKLLFNAYCRSADLPVAKQYGVLSRHASRSTTGYPLASTAQWFHFVAEELPPSVILKPRDGNMGRGVQALTIRTGNAASVGVVQDAITQLRHFETSDDEWVIEQRLACHSDIEALSGTPAVSSVRLFTLVRENGQPDIMDGYFRVIASDSCTDNLSTADGSGLTGNIVALPNLDTGVIEKAWLPDEDGVGYRWVTHHPRTGEPIVGFRLPEWHAVSSTVKQAAVAFLPLVTVGWDVAVTPHGPVLIEGNERYQHAGFGKNTRRLREALENAAGARPRHVAHKPASHRSPAGTG